MSAVVLQGLLEYLKSTLTMDNRQWLAAHLIEPSADVRPYTKEELMARVEEAEADIAAGRFRTEDEMEAFMDRALQELNERKAV
jgi:predicted transcriptional regulator